MIRDGAWIFVYRGESGIGLGFFEIQASRVRGCDWGGIKYRGDVVEVDDEKLRFDLKMDVPANIMHASGASAMDLPHTREKTVVLPRDFDSGEPQNFNMTPGPITVMFYRVPDEYEAIVKPLLAGFDIVPKSS